MPSPETFNSTTSWLCPEDVTSVDAESIGSGASGLLGAIGRGGTGGGGGAYAKKVGITVIPGNSYTVHVGVGGSGENVAGEPSWFLSDTTVLAAGANTDGVGGQAANSIGDVVRTGGDGGLCDPKRFGGAGGGSSAGPDSDGVAGDGGGTTSGGDGGTAPTGGGDGGRGGDNASNAGMTAGESPGGGGGGSSLGGGTVGDGANGQVRLTYTAGPPPAPTLEVTGTADNGTYDYGSVAVNEEVSHQFTIENTGDGEDTLGTLTISGDGWSIDAADNPSGDPLAASGTTTVTVIGTFATAGEKTGILTIPSDDADSPYVVNLTATAVTPKPGTRGSKAAWALFFNN